MIVKGLSRANAKRWLEQRQAGQNPQNGTHEIGSFPRGNFDNSVRSLCQALDHLREELSEVSVNIRGAVFDSLASAVVHRHLLDVGLNVASDRDFWRYLACGPLFDIVRWRYDGSLAPANFGLGAKWEALPERLWFRAYVTMDADAPDPYWLARRGGVDFWASGPIRHAFGAHRHLVKTLIRYQFPDEGEFSESGSYRPQTLTNDEIRVIFKELRHLNAIMILESSSEEQLDVTIREIASHVGF
jgi:hypothetical protein